MGSRPEVTLFYLGLDVAKRHIAYTFDGPGQVSDDPDVNDNVWAAKPDPEQAQDPDRRGVALVVELERVVAQGMKPEQNSVMERTGP
jgi:hypothetical protein